jgi:precorrin-3B C17-methyltransferase
MSGGDAAGDADGWVAIAGLGPGAAGLVTPDVSAALAAATDIVGYGPYVARVPLRAGLTRHVSDNRVELERAILALTLAAAGKRVAVVSSGDPGVFAMAAAVFEAIEAGPPHWRDFDVRVLPGITAMLAAAARVGAPLGHDFCAINLSDNLKPWSVIEARLGLAAQADFAISLYNPLSRARPWQLGRAFEILRGILPADTPVIFASRVSEPDEAIDITRLGEAVAERADMRTVVIVGSAQTRLIARERKPPFVYTPRHWAAPTASAS